MNRVDLNREWRVHEAPLCWDWSFRDAVGDLEEGWLDCDLPADVRMPLLEKGLIREPLVADYCRESEWIEDRSWWFRKCFEGSLVDWEDDVVELVLEGLDTRSDVFVNGHFLGTHRSVHFPFVRDVKEFLVVGSNVVDVRVTSGLEEVSAQDMAELNHAVCLETHNGGKDRGDERRAFVRRPQFTVGWDWGPKVISIGITGNVFLRGFRSIAVREVKLVTASVGSRALVKAMVNVENLSFVGTKSCDLLISVFWEGEKVAERVLENRLLTSGYNYIETAVMVEEARLWWPNGYGEQPLYQVRVEAVCGVDRTFFPEVNLGIRTVELDTEVISGEDRYFRLKVNGRIIFCKGGNWIPNDFIYARVPQRKYQVLLEEAVEANFNMLRVWGGGLYERDVFYELCDKAGILLWHDFMFACSTYPDHHQWFRELMEKEFDYQTKRLRNHCCMALFCGTNEVHWLFNSKDNPRWKIEFSYEHSYGMRTANILAKESIYKNCSEIPYWNSSPYGGALPNADTVGDIHFWNHALMSPVMEDRIEAKDYDAIGAKFVSEYGFIGPCCLESTKEYMEKAALDRESEVWHLHENVFEKRTVYAAIEKNYQLRGEELSLEDYILYGGMVHGLMYGYSLEAMRFKEACGGGLFWMYNDAWGEVGWTVIDYYLRRKIPFYAVKRALAHRKFTMRLEGEQVVLQGMNDSQEDLKVWGRFGYVSYDGKISELRRVELLVPAGERVYLLKEALPERDFAKGTMMLYVEDEGIDNILLRTGDICTLDFAPSQVRVLSREQRGEDQVICVTADGFVHGVYALGDYRCSDLYFDLLPGETKSFTIKEIGNGEAVIKAVI